MSSPLPVQRQDLVIAVREVGPARAQPSVVRVQVSEDWLQELVHDGLRHFVADPAQHYELRVRHGLGGRLAVGERQDRVLVAVDHERRHAQASKLPMQVNLLNVDLRSIFGDGLPGFHYLWMPAD